VSPTERESSNLVHEAGTEFGPVPVLEGREVVVRFFEFLKNHG
jgi:hypothetical protein